MKVIGFNASPRKEGNTAWALNKILESVKKHGAQTQIYHSSDLNIKACQGCLACKKKGEGCVVNDDMQKIYADLKQADTIIFGSPVYMGQMSAQAKTFLDRLFAMGEFLPHFSPYFEGAVKKKMVIVFTQGNPDADRFKAYFDYTKNTLSSLNNFDVKDMLIICGTRSESASEKKELPDRINNIGTLLFDK